MLSLLIGTLILRQTQDPPASLKTTLDSYAERHFNGFLYVERDGKELLFHRVGYADRETKRPYTYSTGIEIGSIVKPMSKIALLKLNSAGKLRLDDPISKFFKNLPADKQAITVRQLMDHTSGFSDLFGDDYEPMKRDQLMKKMIASKLEFSPGAKFQYSNSGYSMLATIMEKVTREPFEKLVSQRVFQPIGLTRTGYILPHWEKEELAVGYGTDGSRWGTPLDHFWFADGPGWNLRGNGGMISTVKELARWVRAAHEGELLDPVSYALFVPGLQPDKVKPNSLWNAAGGNGIFDTVVSYNPSRRLVVVAFSTDARFQIERVLRGLITPIFKLAEAPSPA